MVSMLVPGSSSLGSSPGRGLCVVFLARHFTLTVPLSTREYKWVPANYWGNLASCRGVAHNGLDSCSGGVETCQSSPSLFCYDLLLPLSLWHFSDLVLSYYF